VARIRSVKPETARDAKLARVSRNARYTFILLWTQADDEGYFGATPRALLGDLYPHDNDITEEKLIGELEELRVIGVLQCFDTPDGVLGRVSNFKKHQKIDHPSKSYLATLSRGPREVFGKGVLSPESIVLSQEQDKDLSVQEGQTNGEARKPNLPARRDNSLEAVNLHLAAVGTEHLAKLAKEQFRRMAAELIFSYWCKKFGQTRALYDDHREQPIVRALKANRDDGSELMWAIDGAAADEWAPVELKRHDIPVLFRDRAHIEKYLTSRKFKAGEMHPVWKKYMTPESEKL
jgi:hypothetical protein